MVSFFSFHHSGVFIRETKQNFRLRWNIVCHAVVETFLWQIFVLFTQWKRLNVSLGKGLPFMYDEVIHFAKREVFYNEIRLLNSERMPYNLV